MAKTVAEKLRIKPETTVWCSDPAALDRVGPLPAGARTVDSLAEAATGLVFADSAAAVRALLDAHEDELAGPAAFWVAYPKAGRADINRDSLWPILADYGMRPISQVAVDEVWSALRFRPNKPGEDRFTGGRP
jgi:hypothetical protein